MFFTAEKKENVSRRVKSRTNSDSVDISLESNDADEDSVDEVEVKAATKTKRT